MTSDADSDFESPEFSSRSAAYSERLHDELVEFDSALQRGYRDVLVDAVDRSVLLVVDLQRSEAYDVVAYRAWHQFRLSSRKGRG